MEEVKTSNTLGGTGIIIKKDRGVNRDREEGREGSWDRETGRYRENVTRSGQDERKRERSEAMSERWGGGRGGRGSVRGV